MGGLDRADLETLLQQKPPRSVPQGFKAALRKKILLPMGVLFMVGFGFCLVGGGILAGFFPRHIRQTMQLRSGDKSVVSASVNSCEKTGYMNNHTRVFKISFKFKTPDGALHEGYSYITGRQIPQGSDVEVEYLTSRPEINRAKGMRLDPIGNLILIAGIFPLAGIVMLIFACVSMARAWLKGMSLFKDGAFALGTVSAVDKIDVQERNQDRYRITVSFVGFQTSWYAYHADAMLAKDWQDAKMPLHILYNPEQPDDAIVLEDIFR
jgi:hypothetical protein